jgi:hypothetical protein
MSGEPSREFELLATSEFWPGGSRGGPCAGKPLRRLGAISARSVEGLVTAVATELLGAVAFGGGGSSVRLPLGLDIFTNIGDGAPRQVLTDLTQLPSRARVMLVVRRSYLHLVQDDPAQMPAQPPEAMTPTTNPHGLLFDWQAAAIRESKYQRRVSQAQVLASCQRRLALSLLFHARLAVSPTVAPPATDTKRPAQLTQTTRATAWLRWWPGWSSSRCSCSYWRWAGAPAIVGKRSIGTRCSNKHEHPRSCSCVAEGTRQALLSNRTAQH